MWILYHFPQGGDVQYFCTLHGKNTNHNTGECFLLKNKRKFNNKRPKGHLNTFSANKFQKEINLMAKSCNRQKALYYYANIIKEERASLNKKRKCKEPARKKQKLHVLSYDSESSDSDHSVGIIERRHSRKKARISRSLRLNWELYRENKSLSSTSSKKSNLSVSANSSTSSSTSSSKKPEKKRSRKVTSKLQNIGQTIEIPDTDEETVDPSSIAEPDYYSEETKWQISVDSINNMF